MPQAVGVTISNGLKDRFRAIGLAGVDGFADEMFVDVMVSGQMVGGRVAGFFAGEVKTDHGKVFLFG